LLFIYISVLVDPINHALDHIGVFRIQLQRQLETFKRLVLLPRLLQDFSLKYMRCCFSGADFLELLQDSQGFFEPFHAEKNGGFLVLANAYFVVQLLGSLEPLQSVVFLIQSSCSHSKVDEEYRAPLVDLGCHFEILFSFSVFFLFVVDVSNSPVRRVVSVV